MDWKNIIILSITWILVIFNLYTLITITNDNMKEKGEIIKEQNKFNSISQTVAIQPDKELIACWAVLNISFYLFLISLIHNGKTKESIQN